MRKTFAALTFVASISLLAIACSSGSDNDSSGKSSTTTSGPSTTLSPATISPTTAANGNRCQASQLQGSINDSQGGAGQRYNVLVLRNTGPKSCELRGFPGVSLLNPQGVQFGDPAGREGPEGAAVIIEPNGSASALLHTTAPGIGPSCDAPSAQIKVFPPDNTQFLTISHAYTACGGFNVTTLVPGTAGN